MAALNRWTQQKKDLEDGPLATMTRPKIASEVKTVKECEHWRGQIIREVSKKIAEIQNAALGEHRIRDLNDEINKTLREKNYWEEQIKNLGGPDYKAQAAKASTEAYGAELAGQSGYKYFGAAKDLPGVRELFEKEDPPEAPRKSRMQLFKNIQPDYYGWRDEEDGLLLLAEQQRELELVQAEVARWKTEQPERERRRLAEAEKGVKKAKRAKTTEEEPAKAAPPPALDAGTDFKAYVDVPTMEEIQRLILEKKKMALMNRYASEDLRQQSLESKELLKAPEKAPAE